MEKLSFQDASKLIVSELERTLAAVQEGQAEALLEAILEAQRLFITGEGRSGLVGRCFAVRLMHLGLQAQVVGDTVTPALRKGDLLVAISGTGESGVTLTRARAAAKAGGRVAAVTGSQGSSLASEADLTMLIPAAEAEGKGSTQYGGSLFEQGALVALDAVVLQLQKRLGQSAAEMAARHATVE